MKYSLTESEIKALRLALEIYANPAQWRAFSMHDPFCTCEHVFVSDQSKVNFSWRENVALLDVSIAAPWILAREALRERGIEPGTKTLIQQAWEDMNNE